MNCKESASPTAALESVMITGVIDTHEKHDAATVDAPNTFAQTHMKCKPSDKRVATKIQGVLVAMLVELNPALCKG